MDGIAAKMRTVGLGSFTPTKSSTRHADTYWATQFPDNKTPNLDGRRRVVLAGAQGTGKTSLYNKLTGSTATTSSGTETCTRMNQSAPCLGPFHNVELIDTPGTAVDDVAYDDSFQLREAFIRKPVSLIVLVCGLPSVNRSSEITAVLQPMNKIMRSSTFSLDANGYETGPKSPLRTRVLLALTHRDRFTLPADKWQTYVRHIQTTFEWVGSVVMIDPSVPVPNLLGSVILPATCMTERDYNIPMVEFCSRFPISRKLTGAEEMRIQAKMMEFNQGMTMALAKFNEVKTERSLSGSSSYKDKVGPVMDCVMRFLDDLYERKTLEALSVLEGIPVDDLWAGTDEDVNIARVEKWNAIKSKMGESYESNKRLMAEAFPTRPIDAIYKKCNHCHLVYVKPMGCDFGTSCGNSVGGPDSLPFTYDYEEGKRFHIRENHAMGFFERYAYQLRRNFSTMVTQKPERFYGGQDSGKAVEQRSLKEEKAGCNRPIKWETMIPLTLEELTHHKLIPEGIDYAPTAPLPPDSMQKKMKEVAEQLGLDTTMSMKDQVKKAYEDMGIDDGPAMLKDKIDHLWEVVAGA